VAHLDPDGRGDVRCELLPGDVTQLSPRLWRIAGEAVHVFVATDRARCQAVAIDAGAANALLPVAVQSLGFPALGPSLSTQAGASAPERLQLGADCTLRRIDARAAGTAYLLEQDGILIADADWRAPAAPGMRWLAPTRGFMRRIGSG
jgi:hypothetical protein